MRMKIMAVLAAGAVLGGCYHVTVVSSAKPAATVVNKQWQNSFLDGLVPPPEVSVKDQCPNGVAKVETELSFVNLLAGVITSGIYSPMHLKVTCASK